MVSSKPLQRLPEKFVENNSGSEQIKDRSIGFSEEFYDMLRKQDPELKSPDAPKARFQFTGIKDMLASQSSSRLSVNKEKDKS